MKCTACNRSAEQCISFAHRTCRAIYLAFVFHTAVQARHSISYKHLQSFSLVYVYIIINIIFHTVYASRSFHHYNQVESTSSFDIQNALEDIHLDIINTGLFAFVHPVCVMKMEVDKNKQDLIVILIIPFCETHTASGMMKS